MLSVRRERTENETPIRRNGYTTDLITEGARVLPPERALGVQDGDIGANGGALGPLWGVLQEHMHAGDAPRASLLFQSGSPIPLRSSTTAGSRRSSSYNGVRIINSSIGTRAATARSRIVTARARSPRASATLQALLYGPIPLSSRLSSSSSSTALARSGCPARAYSTAQERDGAR
jgi:hypothetical protein